MTSTYNDIRAAIETVIKTEMAKAPAYPVSYQNVPFTPPNNQSWVQAFVLFGDNAYATLTPPGEGYNRQNGVLTLNVYSPVGVGAGPNLAIAERLKKLFDRKTVASIIFDAASGPAVWSPASPEPYFQTQLTISFEAYVS